MATVAASVWAANNRWNFASDYRIVHYRNIVSRNGARQVSVISHYRDGVRGRSLSVGPTLNLLCDSRANSFGLGHNRLLSGVVFANAQAVSAYAQRLDDPIFKRYDKVAPAAGAGLRVNLNKVSRSNLCIDYARGIQGSSSLSFNVGEVC